MRTLLLAGVGIGAAFGALEVAFPAFAEEDGAASRAGLVFAAQGAGSALGGLVYGARTGAGGAQRAYLVLLAALAPSIALLALAGSLLTMLPLALLSGLVIAPLTAAENELLADVVPEGTLTEAYGWVSTSLVVGIASGNVLAGALVESAGWREAILAAAALSGIAAALALVRGRTLRLAP
jgi:MFS family permease